MKEEITTKVETISPNTALCYLETAGKNRVLSEKKVQDYAKQMTDGEWMLNGEPIIFGKSGRLIDGQHRLRAVVYANAEVRMLVVRGVNDEYFDSIDSGKSRTLQDVFSINGTTNSSLVSSIVKKVVLLKDNPKCLFFRDHSRIAKSRKEIFAEYKKYATVYDMAANFGFRMYRRKRLAPASNIGTIFAYLLIVKDHVPDDVETFFESLFGDKDSSLIRLSAANELRKRIMMSALSGRHFEPKTSQNMFAVAWNAYVQNKEVRKLHASNEEIIEFL